MNAAAMDQLRDLGCNISVTSWNSGPWLVQVTLFHGDEFCGHTARGKEPQLEVATRVAVDALIRGVTETSCGVDVAELRRIAAGL